jgi:cysteine desulfurase
MKTLTNKNIYLDYAGATPIDKKVAKKMSFYGQDFFANPSAIYKGGIKVRSVIEEARGKISKLINAHTDEIIFTSSGTESDALAILGIVKIWRIKNKNKLPHIVTSKIEHPAVLENCRLLENTDEAEVTYVGVDKDGILNLEELKESLKENTILVSIMYANNEIGTIEPIEEIAKIIRHFRKQKNNPVFPILHTDACQAMNYLFTENVEKLGVDLMSFNSSKIYGPKGIGVLYKKRNIDLYPLYKGGGQEFGLHSGTENISLIAGIAEALGITNKIKQKESDRLTKIRNYGINKLLSLTQTSGYKIILNGNKEKRLPNNINVSIFGISSELLVIELDANGIEVSSKSACKSNDNNDSYVIKAIRKICRKDDEEEGSLRITLGRYTKKDDIDKFISVLTKILDKYNKWR